MNRHSDLQEAPKEGLIPKLDRRLIRLGLMVILCAFAWFEAGFAGEVTLGWDANKESDLAGYRLLFGTEKGKYTDTVDVGNATEATLTNLRDGETYFCVVIAYTFDELESAHSTEISFTVPDDRDSDGIPDSAESPDPYPEDSGLHDAPGVGK